MPHISVDKQLRKKKEFNQAVAVLLDTKSKKDSLIKFAEELNELAAAVLQYANKEDNEDYQANFTMLDSISEEFVDVQMHLILIQKLLGFFNLGSVVEQKVYKMLVSKDYNKYLELWKKKHDQ